MTAKTLSYLAAVWRELERRGENLSDLRTGIAFYLPQIAAGTLDAELVVRYAGQRMLLHAAGRLPIKEQRRLVETGHVTLVEPGGQAVREVALHRLSSTDVRFVFGEERLRTTEEQTELRRRALTRLPARRERHARQVRIDGQDILIGGRRAKLARVLQVLSERYGVDAKAVLEAARDSAQRDS